MQATVELLRTPAAQAVLWIGLLLVLLTISWYFLGQLRSRVKGADPPSDYLSRFREMHRQGTLSEREFRTIKSNLGQVYLSGLPVTKTTPEDQARPD